MTANERDLARKHGLALRNPARPELGWRRTTAAGIPNVTGARAGGHAQKGTSMSRRRTIPCLAGAMVALAVLAVSAFGTVAESALGVGYPRPKAASPLRVPLVPAASPCDAPNRTHGPPLSSGSCAPPAQASSFLTVGTPDANSAAPNSVALVVLTAVLGDPGTPADEADVKVKASVTDVRLTAGLGDYAGDLQANARLRLTDRASGPALDEPATVQDFVYRFTVPCQATISTTIGSTCAVTTTADAIQPGTVKERARTIWQIGQIQLFDGGPDGVASTASGNTLFQTQGVFVP